MRAAAVILAGGEGKRMKSALPKAMQEVLFKPMIDWVTDGVERAGIENYCVVTGYAHERLEEHLGQRCQTVWQREQRGTGHAVMQAEAFIRQSGAENIVVLCADAPFFGGEDLKASLEAHISSGNDVTVVTAAADDPFGYGRIVRGGDGSVKKIVEQRDADAEERAITEVNSGIYWFETGALLAALPLLADDNAQHEYYFTDTVSVTLSRAGKVGAWRLNDFGRIAAANDRRQLAALNGAARRAVLDRLYDAGVSIVDESGVIVGPDVSVGRDTVLLPGTILKGHTVIGESCVIGPNSLLESCEVGSGVVFNASQAYRSVIGDGVTVGPFSHLRPDTKLHASVHVGDFVEIKNSEIGEGTKVPHLTYVGDSDVGSKVNFGCGCVTVNYDGVHKHRTKVGDNAFIGCNTNLVAPVEVGDRAYTAAGSTITRAVPPDALAVARQRQENIEGWVTRRRPRKG